MTTYYVFKGSGPTQGQVMKFAFRSRIDVLGKSTKGGKEWKDLSGYGSGKFYDTEEEMKECHV